MQSKYSNCTQSLQLAIVHKVYKNLTDQLSIDSKKEEDKHTSNYAWELPPFAATLHEQCEGDRLPECYGERCPAEIASGGPGTVWTERS